MKEGRSGRLRRKVSWFPGAKFAEQKGTDPVKQDSEELVKEDTTQIKQSDMALSMKPGPRAHQVIQAAHSDRKLLTKSRDGQLPRSKC